MTQASIETVALGKVYGDFAALSDLDLEVLPGEVFGFLGPNGAGKTTTIRLLTGILVPTSGSARICGLRCLEDRVEVMRRVGYLPDTPTFYDYLRGEELLRFVARMHGLSGAALEQRCTALVEQVGLADAAGEYAANYSAGMKKKLALACALVHEPEVLILDEPTMGLDPLASRHIRELVERFAREGRTVFLSTHLLDMAQRLCTRVGMVHHGRLQAVGTPEALRNDLAAGGSLEDVFLAVTGDRAGEAEGAAP